MPKRLTYTPLNVKGIRHYGPPDPDDDDTISLYISPAARCTAVVAGRGANTGQKRKGYARSASERKERRHERRANRRESSSRRGKKGFQADEEDSTNKENFCKNNARPAGAGNDSGDEVISSPEREFIFEKDENEMDDDDDSDAIQESADADFGGSSEFHLDDEKNDDDDNDEGTALEESEDDDDSDLIQKRLFPSTTKKLRIIPDNEEEIQVEPSQESAIEDTKEYTSRSKYKDRESSKRNKIVVCKNKINIYDDSSDDEAIVKEATKNTSTAGVVGKRLHKTTNPNNPNKNNRNFDDDSDDELSFTIYSTCANTKKTSSALISKSKKVSSAKATTNVRRHAAATSKKNSKANPSKSKKAPSNKKLDSSKVQPVLIRKSVHAKSSGVNCFVKAAAAKYEMERLNQTVRAEAATDLAARDKAAVDNSRKKKQVEEKISTKKKSDDLHFEEEEDATAVGSHDETSFGDEASEYQPTQGDDKKLHTIDKTSPRPSRRCSLRINKGTNKTAVQPCAEDRIGMTSAVAPRRRKKSGQTKNTRGFKGQENDEEVSIQTELTGKSSKPDNSKKEKRKSLKDYALSGDKGSDEVRLDTTKRSRKKGKSPTLNNGKKNKSLDLEDRALSYCEERTEVVRAGKTKSRSKETKSSKICNTKKEKPLDLEDGALAGGEEGSKGCREDKTGRRRKIKSSETNSGGKENSLNLAEVALNDGEEDSRDVRPDTRNSQTKKAKSSKKNNCKKEKKKMIDEDDSALSDEEEDNEATHHNGNYTSNADDLDVEYHEAEEEHGTESNESVYDRSMLLTQGAASQFMEQSMGSSTAEADRNNLHVSRIEETELGNSYDAKKLQSICLSTRAISKTQPRASQWEKDVGSNTLVADEGESLRSGKSESSDLPSNDRPREENNKCEKSKNKEHNNSEGNFTSSIVLTTREIANIDPNVLLAAIQTQPHIQCRSQQSSAVSPETKASMAASSLGSNNSENNESEESQGDDCAVTLGGNASSTTSDVQHNLQNKCGETLDKMNVEEMTQALETMGHHVMEVGKIWKQLSSQFGVSFSEGSNA